MNKKKNKIELKKPAGNFSGRRIFILLFLLVIVSASIFYFKGVSQIPIKSGSEPNLNANSVIKFQKEGELTFRSASGEYKLMIDIEIAESPAEIERGLMYRDKMENTRGMLFIFEGDEARSFWMKNTHIPLDIIFVNGAGEIVTVRENTMPYSETSIESTAPARFVVEVIAGFSAENKIRVGDKIVWRRVEN